MIHRPHTRSRLTRKPLHPRTTPSVALSVLALALALANAAPAPPAPQGPDAITSTASGPVQIKDSKGNDGDKSIFAVSLGSNIVAKAKFYAVDFFDRKVVWAGADLDNVSTNETLHYSYNVAFFDAKTNLLGCAAESSSAEGLPPGGKTQLGSCIVQIPRNDVKKVASYRATLHESRKPIGGK